MDEMQEMNEGRREEIRNVEDAISEWKGKIDELKTVINPLPLNIKLTREKVSRLKHRNS